ncbi:MAG: anthranilate synthase component [Clostridiales bacterium]|nr:anthranilate synthase component [Clostridiales bacterium]
MNIFPSKEEALRYSPKEYDIVPLCLSLYADELTPVGVMKILKKVSRHCYLLESVEEQKKWGRYTFLGYQPTLELTCHNHELTIRSKEETKTVTHPKEVIRKILREFRSPKIAGMPTFTGGLVGYFSYDYIKYSEPTLVLDAEDEDDFKDMDLMLFDRVIAFDNEKQQVLLIVHARTTNMEENYELAKCELYEMAKLLFCGEKGNSKPLICTGEWKAMFDEAAYCNMVERAKEYIKEGDIFQVVLSNRMEAEVEGSLLDTYRVLRTLNPSPYMFYFTSDDIEIAGASPETLVKLSDGKLFTYPLAGTRPRGKSPAEDEDLVKELLSDEKELAEHNMLVDLGRNDIGKISKIGSVVVEKYANIERFSHVFHIGSTVSGSIKETKDAMDAVDAILPAGTLSGAPKLRACEIINELEGKKRGIYGGAIGYISFTGELDTCIAIRLAYKKNGRVYVRSGAGIVADSVPKKEYEECINKAKAVVAAISLAKGGIDLDFTD